MNIIPLVYRKCNRKYLLLFGISKTIDRINGWDFRQDHEMNRMRVFGKKEEGYWDVN
jgi:hypothetical protein